MQQNSAVKFVYFSKHIQHLLFQGLLIRTEANYKRKETVKQKVLKPKDFNPVTLMLNLTGHCLRKVTPKKLQ